jgi:hypothetical protein
MPICHDYPVHHGYVGLPEIQKIVTFLFLKSLKISKAILGLIQVVVAPTAYITLKLWTFCAWRQPTRNSAKGGVHRTRKRLRTSWVLVANQNNQKRHTNREILKQ